MAECYLGLLGTFFFFSIAMSTGWWPVNPGLAAQEHKELEGVQKRMLMPLMVASLAVSASLLERGVLLCFTWGSPSPRLNSENMVAGSRTLFPCGWASTRSPVHENPQCIQAHTYMRVQGLLGKWLFWVTEG